VRGGGGRAVRGVRRCSVRSPSGCAGFDAVNE
jgi:hypothetical protein